MSDARQIVTDYFALDTDESTILRHESVRVRSALYTGTTDSDTETSVKLSGLKDPIVVGITVMIESATDNWGVYSYRQSVSATDNFHIVYRGPNHGSNTNEVLITGVGSSYQGQKYRIFVFYLDRSP